MWQKIDKGALLKECELEEKNISLNSIQPSLAVVTTAKDAISKLEFVNSYYLRDVSTNPLTAANALHLLCGEFPYFPHLTPNKSHATMNTIIVRELKKAFSELTEEVKTPAFSALLKTDHAPTGSVLLTDTENMFSLVKVKYQRKFRLDDTVKALLDTFDVKKELVDLHTAVYFNSLISSKLHSGASLHLLPSSLAGVLRWSDRTYLSSRRRTPTVLECVLLAEKDPAGKNSKKLREYILSISDTEEVLFPDIYSPSKKEILKELIVGFSDEFKDLDDLLKASLLLLK